MTLLDFGAYMKKNPEQTERTRQNIITAFWILAQKNGLHNVSISDLMKKAGYNRGTFYVYFFDMNDLLEQAEEDIIEELKFKMQDALKDLTILDFEMLANKMVDTFASYDDKLYLLLGSNGDSKFIAKVRNEMAKIFSTVFNMKENNETKDYIIVFITSAFVGVLTRWYESGKQMEYQKLAKLIQTLATKGLSGILSQ